MNKHELRTVTQETQRFSKDVTITTVDNDVLKLDLPFTNSQSQNLYFFITKRKGSGKFSILIPVESTGLVPDNETIYFLQPMMKTYGLLLSSEPVTIMEDSNLPLNRRIRNMAQAMAGIDGIRRLWAAAYNRRQDAESKVTNPTSNGTHDSPSH